MALVGALAGFFLWFLPYELTNIVENDRLILVLSAFTGGFFVVLLAAMGPLRPRIAGVVALSLALVAAALLFWASYRYEDISGFLETGYVVVAFLVLLSIPLPFLLAGLSPGEGWRNYPALFNHAWQILVRYLVAWAFTGAFWLVLMLSAVALNIVGLKVIERALEIDSVPFVLTGLVLGLGMAMVHEFRAYVSPFLALRLLSLLLPMVLLVSAVFLLSIPFKGLSNLFGDVSAAGTLVAMAMIGVMLVAAVLDADEENGATLPVLVWSARVMALILPFLGGLAAWALWLRVVQHGWTPNRLAAAVAVLVVLGYGLAYGFAVLRGAGWRQHIRRANITMALGVVALAALWLTPVLNGERLSVNSQMARFMDGRISVEALDVLAMEYDWGRAGKAGLERLRASLDPPNQARLQEILSGQAETETEIQRQARKQEEALQSDLRHEELLRLLQVRPKGAILPEELLRASDRHGSFLKGCHIKTPAGNAGCLALVGDFLPAEAGNEVAILFLLNETRMQMVALGQEGAVVDIVDISNHWGGPAQLDAILQSGVLIGPSLKGALLIGEYKIEIDPTEGD